MDELAHGEKLVGHRDAFVVRHDPIKIRVHPANNFTNGFCGTRQKTASNREIGGKLTWRKCFAEPMPMIALNRGSGEVVPLNIEVRQLRQMAPELN
jgi:hypothetical protein